MHVHAIPVEEPLENTTEQEGSSQLFFQPKCCTCVLGNVIQKKRVLSESLHLGGNDVLQLKTTAQGVTLSVLKSKWRKSTNKVYEDE